MISELTNSLKARLYDFKYTPFLSSFVILWVYFNAKTILIILDDRLKIEDKIDMLSYDDLVLLKSLFFAVVYTVFFPIINLAFNLLILWYKSVSKKCQLKIEGKTPLPQDEANMIIEENHNLRLKINEKNKEIESMNSEFDKKIILKDEETENAVKSRTEKLQDDLNKSKEEVKSKDSIIKSQNIEIERLKSELNVFQEAKDTTKDKTRLDITDTQIQILKIFYIGGSSLSKSYLTDSVHKEYGIGRAVAELELERLEEKGILSYDDVVRSYMKLTNKGFEYIEKLKEEIWDKEK